jgi:hypothetical protein
MKHANLSLFSLSISLHLSSARVWIILSAYCQNFKTEVHGGTPPSMSQKLGKIKKNRGDK